MKPWIVGLSVVLFLGVWWTLNHQGQTMPTPIRLTTNLPGLPVAATADPQTASKPLSLTVCPQGPPSCQFGKIQSAIDVAPPGSSLLIQPGTYAENLVLSKSLQLIGTEADQVRIEGTQSQGTTIKLSMPDKQDLQVLLEGITILGSPDGLTTSGGLGIDGQGQGSLALTLADSQITQVATGLWCVDVREGFAQVSLVNSRFVPTYWGIVWRCGFQGTTVSLAGVTMTGSLDSAGILWEPTSPNRSTPGRFIPPKSPPASPLKGAVSSERVTVCWCLLECFRVGISRSETAGLRTTLMRGLTLGPRQREAPWRSRGATSSETRTA